LFTVEYADCGKIMAQSWQLARKTPRTGASPGRKKGTVD
jgi:hypothetical protein